MTTKEAHNEEMESQGFGCYSVTVLPHVEIALEDGTIMALKIWFPSADKDVIESQFCGVPYHCHFEKTTHLLNDTKNFPAVLEYLPYRKSDFTVPRDHCRHAWMSSHGYVCIRADMRGTGESGGLYFDEYLQTEQKDACDLIKWIVDQPWCSGKVGMYGKSWGGFNGLQLAFEQPQGLSAVISLYSTDDRYESDIHWEGGCVIGNGMLSWASRMFLWNCTPPCPQYCPQWKEEWMKRLQNASESWCKTWLSHQTRDNYWRHGSINRDYSRVEIPVLAIGGWNDSYVDAVFRMVDNLPNVKALIGPWSHDWPDCSKPGPNIEFLHECLRWWDHHLKGKPSTPLPKFRVFVVDSILPTRSKDFNLAGEWIKMTSYVEKSFIPSNDTLELVENAKTTEYEQTVKFNSSNGKSSSEWLSFGEDDSPADQNDEDCLSTVWTSKPLENVLNIVGFITLKTKVKVQADRASLAVRVCDIHPNGESTLITYGIYNIAHHKGHDDGLQERLTKGKVYALSIKLHSIGYRVPIGHKLRLAISSNYWPIKWPSPSKDDIILILGSSEVDANFHTELLIPTVDISSNLCEPEFINVSKAPQIGPALPSLSSSNIEPAFELTTNQIGDTITRKVDVDSGDVVIKEGDLDMMYRERSSDVYTLKQDDPLSAQVTDDQDLHLEWTLERQRIVVDIVTHSKMTCDEENFFLLNEISVKCDGAEQFSKKWEDAIPRYFV